MKNNLRYSSLLLLMIAAVAVADRPAPDRQYTIRSPNGNFEFTMHPAVSDGDSSAEPFGEAYGIAPTSTDVSEEGGRTRLWRVTGWYSSSTFISNDGRSLVRMGPWASLPVGEELAVAFYRDGQEIRRYAIVDLIDDENSVRRTASHYTWQANDNDLPRLTDDGDFQLRTIENRLVTFETSTGEVSSSVPGNIGTPAESSDLPGIWQGGPCGERNFTRTLRVNTDKTFEVVDRAVVTYKGTWRAVRPTMIQLVPNPKNTRSHVPLALMLDLRGGLLNEATPGAQPICTYSRMDQSPEES